MQTDLVDYVVSEGVATITLNDPPMNAYTHEMMKDLDAAIVEARFDNEVHVIVLVGHGEKFFCAGANVRMLSEVDTTYKYYFCLHANETISRLEQTPKLVIGALNGHCVGGGLEIALACDLRIARAGAGKIGLPARLVGKSIAIQMMVEGATYELDRALEMGLVNYVWEADDRDAFLARVQEYARQFTPPNKASLAVGRIKRAVQTGAELPLEYGLAFERELQAELFGSADATEGLAAYVGKRKPEFSAR
ncbi:MAG: enoyl-CoA hydratase/isomerase family protein [Deltaproteobacteria bacterium]|nr:enoyl-CoA hydratase/isomerase family protein [Deltaproteobacteria bacterium]